MPVLGYAKPWQRFVPADLLLVVLPCDGVLSALRQAAGRAIVLTSNPSALEAAVVLAAGSSGYLPTTTHVDELRRHLAAVGAGELALLPHGAAGLAAVLRVAAGPEQVLAAATLAARGMPWSIAQVAAGALPGAAAAALAAARDA